MLWAVYAVVLVGLIASWFMFRAADGIEVCGRAVKPGVEYGQAGLSYVPPGYVCLTTTEGNFIAPLDRGGWIEWGVTMAIPLTLLAGVGGLVVQMRRS